LAVIVVKQTEYGVMAYAPFWFGGGTALITLLSADHEARIGGFQLWLLLPIHGLWKSVSSPWVEFGQFGPAMAQVLVTWLDIVKAVLPPSLVQFLGGGITQLD
jgi:hypothetical protein